MKSQTASLTDTDSSASSTESRKVDHEDIDMVEKNLEDETEGPVAEQGSE